MLTFFSNLYCLFCHQTSTFMKPLYLKNYEELTYKDNINKHTHTHTDKKLTGKSNFLKCLMGYFDASFNVYLHVQTSINKMYIHYHE